jgi:hypothetical protein
VSQSIIVVSDADAPTVRATVDGELSCAGSEVQIQTTISGGRQPYAIQWTRSGIGVIGCEASLLVSQPGTYTVTVTGANGCTAMDTVTVLQDLQAPRISAIASGELTCKVSQVKLTALASNGRLPYTYEWKSPSGSVVGTASEVYVSQPGTYSIRVVGANGCSAMATVIVTEDKIAPVVDIRGAGLLTCATTEITLTANVSSGRPSYQIEWTGPSGNIVSTTPVVTATMPGAYAVTVTGANGCASTASVMIEQDILEPTVDAGADRMLSDEILQVTVTATIGGIGGGSYAVAWTNDSGDVLSTNETIPIDRPGVYTVTVTRSTGCSASDTVIVNSSIITEVMLNSGIEGLAVFGQLTMDGVPVPGTAFHFATGDIAASGSGVEISSVSLRTGTGQGYEANGAEVNYIIPGNAIVTFQIHKDQFIAGKWYPLLHLPADSLGAAAVKFF